jgi:hypothetical protein
MKKLLFSLMALTLTTTITFAQKKAADVAQFKTDAIDMGKIPQGTPATVTFIVTNISKEPLIIEQANPTCGCTIGDFTKEPIAPGKEGKITATYNAANLNAFEKHMNVKFAGVDEMKSITIKGEVLNADDYAKFKAANPAVAPTATQTKTEVSTKPAKKAKQSSTLKVRPASPVAQVAN